MIAVSALFFNLRWPETIQYCIYDFQATFKTLLLRQNFSSLGDSIGKGHVWKAEQKTLHCTYSIWIPEWAVVNLKEKYS
jgi:hypothetical protein